MEPIALILHVANILLLIALLYVFLQNARHLKAKVTYGLVLFSLVLLAQSVMDLYFEASMVMYSLNGEAAAMTLSVIKVAAFAVLLWISWE